MLPLDEIRRQPGFLHRARNGFAATVDDDQDGKGAAAG